MKRIITTLITLVLVFVIGTGIVDGLHNADVLPGRDKTVREKYEKLDYESYGMDAELWEKLLKAAERDERLVVLLENIDIYTYDMIFLAVKNEEARDFIAGYPENTNNNRQPSDISLTAEEENAKVPRFLQWDTRWGYENYGGQAIGVTGCGPTCLSMVTIALTGDTSQNPLKVAQYAESNGYYVEGVGSSWDLLRSGVAPLGLSYREISLDEQTMADTLNSGELIICSMLPGDFTSSGHFIVITGYENGAFRVIDPNSVTRSEKLWKYSDISSQIAVIWAYSAY